MTKAQVRALTYLYTGPITETGLIVYGIQRRTLQALQEQGFAKFRPYGKPPSWAITQAGWKALNG